MQLAICFITTATCNEGIGSVTCFTVVGVYCVVQFTVTTTLNTFDGIIDIHVHTF